MRKCRAFLSCSFRVAEGPSGGEELEELEARRSATAVCR